MLCTIILDSYTKEGANELATAIDDNCSPNDSWGWSSAGVYSFWDYDTKEILYIGLAVDLALRFKQHNGLVATTNESCKHQQIQNYFLNKEQIGYTIFVQSPLSQPANQRNEKEFRRLYNIPDEIPIENYPGEEGLRSIRTIEGQLIEAHRMATGDIPKWNKVGGSIDGRRYASIENHMQILRQFSIGDTANPLVSRSTITELAKSATYQICESCLHGLRMMILYNTATFDEAIQFHKENNPYFHLDWDNNVIKNNYLDKKLII